MGTALAEVPTQALGFVPVPSEAFIYDYVVAHPNVTEFGTGGPVRRALPS